MLEVLGLSPCFVRTEELEGPGEVVGRRVGDSLALCRLPLFFSPALCLKGTAGLFTHQGTSVKGEQLRGKATNDHVNSPTGSDEGWETDRRHVFSERG